MGTGGRVGPKLNPPSKGGKVLGTGAKVGDGVSGALVGRGLRVGGGGTGVGAGVTGAWLLL